MTAAVHDRVAPGAMPRWFEPLNPPLRHWAGRGVWIVGGSTGIGRATALRLQARGAVVHVSARDAGALQALAGAHPGIHAWPLDVLDAAAVRAAARQILAHGPLDLVFVCAGHYRPVRATAFDLGEMQRHQAVNYGGALHVLDAVLPAMLARRSGHVSLAASVAGYRALPHALAYGPTKAALIHLAQGLYLDLRARGVGVSVVNPGFVETPLTAQNPFPMPALVTADVAATEITAGWEAGRFEIHFPRRFTLLLQLLRLLPFRWYVRIVRRVTGP